MRDSVRPADRYSTKRRYTWVCAPSAHFSGSALSRAYPPLGGTGRHFVSAFKLMTHHVRDRTSAPKHLKAVTVDVHRLEGITREDIGLEGCSARQLRLNRVEIAPEPPISQGSSHRVDRTSHHGHDKRQ